MKMSSCRTLVINVKRRVYEEISGPTVLHGS